jgi:hypothetical protein
MSSRLHPDRAHLKRGRGRIPVVWPAAAVLALVLVSTTSWTQAGGRSLENEAGGYSVTYPRAWEAITEGPVSKLVSPSEMVVISIGPGVSDSLSDESERSADLLERTYEEIRISEPRPLTIGTSSALEISGTAINDAGVRVRFRAIAIEGSGGNRFIMAFAATDAPADEASAINGVVSSFRPLAVPGPPEGGTDDAAGSVEGGVEGRGFPIPLLAGVLGALLVVAAWIARRSPPEPAPEHDYVRVHLRDGRWIEGWRKVQSLNRVIILDPVATCDREGLKKSPAPEDSFIPESTVVRIEPRERRPSGV